MENSSTIALSRLVAQQRTMDVTAANIANSGTPGFKAERVLFSDWLSGQTRTNAPAGDRTLAYTQDRATYRTQAEGALTHTGNPLDLALGTDGYFTVATAQGPRLTRAGRFDLQPDGTIGDADGHALLDAAGQPIHVAATDSMLQVAGDGTLSSENGRIGKIGIVQASDVNRMTAEGARLFRADVSTSPVANPKIVQGAVEESNVQPMAEMARMMNDLREFQFVSQFVEAESQRQQMAIDKLTHAPT